MGSPRESSTRRNAAPRAEACRRARSRSTANIRSAVPDSGVDAKESVLEERVELVHDRFLRIVPAAHDDLKEHLAEGAHDEERFDARVALADDAALLAVLEAALHQRVHFFH